MTRQVFANAAGVIILISVIIAVSAVLILQTSKVNQKSLKLR